MAFGPHLMPVCARCEGLYLGFLIMILFGWFTGRAQLNRNKGRAVCGVSLLLAAALIGDAAASELGLWDSGNRVRLLLGLMGGGGIAVFAWSLFRHTFLDKTAPWSISMGPRGFLLANAVVSGLWALHFSESGLWFHVLSFAAGAGVFCYYLFFNLAIAGTLMDWRAKKAGLKEVLILGGIVAALLGAELSVTTWLHRS